jgi:hypothetical protein
MDVNIHTAGKGWETSYSSMKTRREGERSWKWIRYEESRTEMTGEGGKDRHVGERIERSGEGMKG